MDGLALMQHSSVDDLDNFALSGRNEGTWLIMEPLVTSSVFLAVLIGELRSSAEVNRLIWSDDGCLDLLLDLQLNLRDVDARSTDEPFITSGVTLVWADCLEAVGGEGIEGCTPALLNVSWGYRGKGSWLNLISISP